MLTRFLSPVFIMLILSACAPMTRVTHVSGDVYNITETGGWGYDLKALKSQVQDQAKQFAATAGKNYEIIDENVVPDSRVDIYPADDDTYSLTFRLTPNK